MNFLVQVKNYNYVSRMHLAGSKVYFLFAKNILNGWLFKKSFKKLALNFTRNWSSFYLKNFYTESWMFKNQFVKNKNNSNFIQFLD